MDAEQAVLGAILLDGEVTNRVSAILSPDDFYHEAHREIFRAVLNLHDRGDAVDLVTVIDELRRAGTLDRIGGAAYVASLADLVPTTANVEYYARIVEEKALLRTLIRVAARIAEMGYEESDSAMRLVDQAEQMIIELGSRRAPGVFMALKDILMQTWERIEKVYEQGRITGIPTGFIDLDRILSGFQPSDLIILAARPSMGKTSLALSIAHQVASQQRLPVGIFSLEMSKEQLVQRLLCAEAMVDQYRLRTGLLREEDWERLTEAAATLARLPIYIDDTAACSVREMRAKARRLKAEVGLGLIIVDYLQLMQPNRRAENRQQEIAQISRALKGLAKELDVPVLALSQLSRAVEQRQDKRPQMADLRESGCLAGDTLVQLSGGQRLPIQEIVRQGLPVQVMALNEKTWKLEPAQIRKAWCTGTRQVFLLRTRLGREVRATANHRFRTLEGWKRLDELKPGEHIAVPRPWKNLCARGATLTPTEADHLGHLIGDGCTLARHAVQSTTNDRGLADVVVELADQFETLVRLGQSDVCWDQVVSIEAGDVEDVYDLEVPGHHNFVAGDIVVHNSLEQDADVVMFIYRDEYYRPDTEKRGVAEIIVAKQRNGPVGVVEMGFLKEFTRFVNLARETEMDAPLGD